MPEEHSTTTSKEHHERTTQPNQKYSIPTQQCQQDTPAPTAQFKHTAIIPKDQRGGTSTLILPSRWGEPLGLMMTSIWAPPPPPDIWNFDGCIAPTGAPQVRFLSPNGDPKIALFRTFSQK